METKGSRQKITVNKSPALVRWNMSLYGSETWTLRKLERKNLESFQMLYWRRMEKIKWSEKVTNEQVLDCIGVLKCGAGGEWRR